MVPQGIRMTEDMQRTLGNLEAQNQYIIKMLEQNREDHLKMEGRVTSLESKVSWATGVGATLIATYPLVLHYMGIK